MENLTAKTYNVSVYKYYSSYEINISIYYNNLKWWQTALVNIGYLLLIIPGVILSSYFTKKTGGSEYDRHKIRINKYNWRNEVRNNQEINRLPFSNRIINEIYRKIEELEKTR